MVLDLSGIKKMVEDDFMTDTCRITRDSDGTADEVWDPETLEYTGANPETIYEGKCYVSTSGRQGTEPNYGGAEYNETVYNLNIPLESPEVLDGDLVVILTSLRDPSLVDETFYADLEDVGSFKVKRKIHMRRVQPTGRG